MEMYDGKISHETLEVEINLGVKCHKWRIRNEKVSCWKDVLSISIGERFCSLLEIRAS
jgi:hypothetical protein